MEADTAYFYESTQITELRNVKVIFFDLKGEEGSTLTSKRGTYRWQDGSMEANDNVVVVSPDGRRLATATLKYDNASNTISTDKHFTFDRGDRASGGEQLPLRSRLQERRDRPAARRGGRRYAAAGTGGEVTSGRRLRWVGDARRRRLRVARGRPEQPVRLPDRQRRPPGRRGRDRQGHQLLRRRQRAAQLPRARRSPCGATASRPTAAASSSSSAT